MKQMTRKMIRKVFVIIIVLIIISLFIAAATGNIKAFLTLWKMV